MQRLLPALALLALGGNALAAPPVRFLREQRQVTVAGQQEVWKLVWIGQPRSFCGPEDPEMAMTCPCSGWAYGGYGRLQLQRQRGGKVVDTLELGPLFGDALPVSNAADLAGMPWRPMYDRDWMSVEGPPDAATLSEIRRRPGLRIIDLADYDHDGVASEFLVQVDTLPCGKHLYAAVGISRLNPKLHALSSTGHPERPLIMPGQVWEALRQFPASRWTPTWECDDHGSEVHTDLQTSARGGRLTVRNRAIECHGPREGKLSSDEPF